MALEQMVKFLSGIFACKFVHFVNNLTKILSPNWARHNLSTNNRYNILMTRDNVAIYRIRLRPILMFELLNKHNSQCP